MSWSDQIFRYCERGQDPAFWAEPFNALSNVGYLIAAALLARRLSQHHSTAGWQVGTAAIDNHAYPRLPLQILVTLVAIIGIGSFLFHTFATRWSRTADVVPIGVFMALYFVFALRLFLGWSTARISVALVAFLAATLAASTIACPASMRSITDYAREPCLKGTMGYVPALFAVLVTGAMVRQSPGAGQRLLIAGGIFLGAMILRWLDRDVCAATMLLGQPRGTHSLWHLLTAAALFVLVSAAIDAAFARHNLPSRLPHR